MDPIFGGTNFFGKLGQLLRKGYPVGQKFIEISLSSMVFEIQGFLCFAFLKKIRKFKMATIFGN